jgi:hypothetical protein
VAGPHDPTVDGGERAESGGADEASEEVLDDCTAVLVALPLDDARRLERFLRAKDVRCRIRPGAIPSVETSATEAVRGQLRLRRPAPPAAPPPQLFDVLVRPDDLPPEPADRALTTAGPTEPLPAPTEDALLPVELCQLPWDEAWQLVERLSAEGVRATVLSAAGANPTMERRVVPVGVHADDLDRARSLLGG